ncbi:MAG: NAD(P)-dependent oxidoreductase [Sphingomonadales bacterium]|nr:NAD(P)-dependent oxidoreductase [Sphingomonadales bacterium]MDE2167882.1 NAD(P)-dependent oxidoreductase [Sphingomonadales bacterium]
MVTTPSASIPAAPFLALIGFGEAGETFAAAAGWDESHAAVHDVRLARLDHARDLGLATGDAALALAGAQLVLCLVTADQVLEAARACAPHLGPGAIWCDGNSVAPGTKREAAAVIEAAGGIYVDMAILAPVNPARLKVPLLLAGVAASRAQGLLAAAGFTNIRVVGDEVGRASAIKMIRSVMVKGVEALTAEMMLGAQQAGVVDEVLASLDASDKPAPWGEKAAYNIERMVTHGARRAAEMEESVRTLEGLGIEPLMTRGTVARQRDMAGRRDRLIQDQPKT